MASPLRALNHIAFHVANGAALVRELVSKFQFHLFAVRVTEKTRQLALKKGSAVFLVNERPKLDEAAARECARHQGSPALPCISFGDALPPTHPAPDFLYDVRPPWPVDTASNVCFEVEDVSSLCSRLHERGCQILAPPTAVQDDSGRVTYCVVKSIVGNVSHTLIDRSCYSGEFLPGFHRVTDSPATAAEPTAVTHVDHVTCALLQGSSPQVLQWYEKCFGFQRFQLHWEDKAEGGYVMSGDGMGLRLSAMHYWRCSKVALSLPLPCRTPACMFVLAESLPGQGQNQVDTFLDQHGGAGIQHVGLSTPDIVGTARALHSTGVRFVTPPAAYYTDAEKQEEIRAAGQDPHLLSQLGVLLDTDMSEEGVRSRKRYLLQVFTKPLFSAETFFLELIERQGAVGFGEGNIRALWRAMQVYMDQKEQKQRR
ncbi:4-hydroxyphenylpyruvate dioxygenase-like protein isoform X2 [Rhinatrema bivittatum]|nr:4-hydroxyphenylpyruvate dioxygenase-like protein isoform X2 [Rhinatrema bivittatum]